MNLDEAPDRVLKPGGSLYVWDSSIAQKETKPQTLYVVPVAVKLPQKTIQTAYGFKWSTQRLDEEILAKLALEVGFTIKEKTTKDKAFYLVCQKSEK